MSDLAYETVSTMQGIIPRYLAAVGSIEVDDNVWTSPWDTSLLMVLHNGRLYTEKGNPSVWVTDVIGLASRHLGKGHGKSILQLAEHVQNTVGADCHISTKA
jgi:hypothetical protein